MKKLFPIFVLSLFLLTGCGSMGGTDAEAIQKYDFTWDSPTTNEDGTPLTDLAGFIFYCGISSGAYNVNKNVGNANTIPINDILYAEPLGKYYCAVTAYDTSDNESRYSDEIMRYKSSRGYFDGVPPGEPTNLD